MPEEGVGGSIGTFRGGDLRPNTGVDGGCDDDDDDGYSFERRKRRREEGRLGVV